LAKDILAGTACRDVYTLPAASTFDSKKVAGRIHRSGYSGVPAIQTKKADGGIP
jgi:hypothetical protein